jgi:hypothetical protein
MMIVLVTCIVLTMLSKTLRSKTDVWTSAKTNNEPNSRRSDQISDVTHLPSTQISPHEIPARDVEEKPLEPLQNPPIPKEVQETAFAPLPPKFNDVNGDRPQRE